MLFARLLSKIFNKKGIILIDSQGQKYICGKPDLKNPLTVKLLKKDFAPEELEGSDNAEETLLVSLFDGRIFTLNLQKHDASYENYILTMRMGILQGASESANAEDSIIRQEMDVFNKRVNGRFFEISSWVGKELLLSDQ